jgi:nucleotide-binding universal stress UspA family protein
MKTIVCAVDKSPGAAEALRIAAGLSKGLGLRLVLAHVAEGFRLPDGTAGVTGLQAQRAGQRLLEHLAREHVLSGDADRRAEVGERASELARIASEEAAALIVVGSRTQGRRRRRLLSGLAAELNGTAPCPVLVVPPRAQS